MSREFGVSRELGWTHDHIGCRDLLWFRDQSGRYGLVSCHMHFHPWELGSPDILVVVIGLILADNFDPEFPAIVTINLSFTVCFSLVINLVL